MAELVKRGVVDKSVSEAWKGFKGWWIPLCMLSFALILTQSWIPKFIIKKFPEFKIFELPVKGFFSIVSNVMENFGRIDHAQINDYINFLFNHFTNPNIQAQFGQLVFKALLVSFSAVIVVCFIHIALIVASKAACGKKEDRGAECKHGLKKSPQLYFSYLILTVVKIVPWFFFIIPGFYLYIKLYFTGFLITEESADPFKAMKESWKMSSGYFWEISIIFLITLAIDSISAMTIIGFIPGTSMKYTLRASLYRQLKEGVASV